MISSKNYIGEPIPTLEQECKPIFIVGMNGSGTTMLADCLSHHPELYSSRQETKLIPYYISTVKEYGDLGEDDNFLRLWNSMLSMPAITFLNGGYKVPLPLNWQEFPRNLASVLDACFRYFAAKQGKVRWCEKSPQYVQHILSLHGLFPGAKFIHIIRDGRDCAASLHRRWKKTPQFSIYRWKNAINDGRRQGALLDPVYYELKYEELTANPEYWMYKICNFLEIPYHTDIVLSRWPQSGRSGQIGKIENNSDKWRQYFSPKEIYRMESIAGACLYNLNYDVQYLIGTHNPPRIKLSYWRWKDYGVQFFISIIEKLFCKSKRSWSVLFKRIGITLKQLQSNRY